MKAGIIAIGLAAALLCGCQNGTSEKKVMARYVPERMDDFVWENNLVCYRAYGPALEGNPTSPGFDLWVKLPGKLVADEWYKGALQDADYYHHDHGGKDCYKVAVSLGAGASAPLVDGKLVYPDHNYRSWEILSESDDQVVFVLRYDAWPLGEGSISLDKKITVDKDTYFCKAEDTYSGDFDSVTVAAGIFTHEVEDSLVLPDRIAIWEHPSDTSVEPEESMVGVAVHMPEAEASVRVEGVRPHLVCTRTIRPGETLTYWFGSCWSKGDIKTAEDWFALVESL